MGSYIVVDIGGSGARIGVVSEQGIAGVQRESIHSVENLVDVIKSRSANIQGIAISVAGFVYADSGCVSHVTAAPFLEGNLKEKLGIHFPDACIHIVNDGEAHALALLNIPNVKLGAINLAIGTSVGFGVLNERGEPVKTVSGENWEINELSFRTRVPNLYAWIMSRAYVGWGLGENGIEQLKQAMGTKSYKHIGCRLGAFASQLAVIFRPRTIGFSGGYISRYWPKIEDAVRKEFQPPPFMNCPELIAQKDSESALVGLSFLFKQNEHL